MQEKSSPSKSAIWRNRYVQSAILFLLILTGFSMYVKKVNSTRPMISSDVHMNADFPLDWLSNDEIIFSGTENTSHASGSGVYLKTISIWKMGAGVRIYKRHIQHLCYEFNSLAYTIKDNPNDLGSSFYGTLGDEKPATHSEIDWSSCRSIEVLGDRTRHLRHLLPEHGYLDRGPIRGDLKNIPIVFYKKGDEQGMTLPLMSRENGGIRYYAFKNAYLVDSDYLNPVTNIGQSPWPGDVPRPLWWLTPEGVTTKFVISFPWNRSSSFFYTKVGIVAAGYDQRVTMPRFSDQGLYLLKPDGSVETLIKGEVEKIAISPDGCAIAFAHFEIPLHGDSVILKVIQLCSQGK